MENPSDWGAVAVEDDSPEQWGAQPVAETPEDWGAQPVEEPPKRQIPESVDVLRPTTLKERIALSPVGQFLGIGTGAERAIQRERGGAQGILPQDIIEKGFQLATPPPPVKEAISKATDPLANLLPDEAAGVTLGLRDVGLDIPWAAGAASTGRNLGRALLGVFTGQYVWDLPEQKAAFDAAMAAGDKKGAYRIATSAIAGGILLGAGAKHELGQLRGPKVAAVPSEAPTGQPEAIPPTLETQPTTEVSNASSQPEAAAVHGDLRPQPEVSPGEMPAAQGSGGILPREEPAQGSANAPTVPAEAPRTQAAVEPNDALLDQVSNADGQTFSALAQEWNKSQGGQEKVSHRIGRAVTSLEEVAILKELWQKAQVELAALKGKPEMMDERMRLASKPQFFREAYEEATGTGGSANKIGVDPTYKPPFPFSEPPPTVAATTKLKQLGLNNQQVVDVVSGKRSVEDVVTELLSGFEEQVNSNVDRPTGTLDHAQAIEMAYNEAIAQINEILQASELNPPRGALETVPGGTGSPSRMAARFTRAPVCWPRVGSSNSGSICIASRYCGSITAFQLSMCRRMASLTFGSARNS
jgi:hypothetical protein